MGSVGILTHTLVADDPRVRRQIEAFAGAGWNVVAIGMEGGRSSLPDVRLGLVPLRPPDRSATGRLRRISVLSVAKLAPFLADQMFWLLPERYGAFLDLARHHRPDLWLVNDWTMLPIVSALIAARPVPYLYDTHEFAYDEFPEDWKWRIFMRPLVRRLEAKGIARAAAVTCVSAGISRRLREVYDLPRAPMVVRNTPSFEDIPFRPCGERIEVLYHGIVSPNRGLEQIIRSVGQWRPEFALTIRGPGQETYLKGLEALALSVGVTDRVRFDPPVPLTDLVRAAAAHDIGLFVLSGGSPQNEFVLPNKLFEYAMAGLCLCVSDLPEMAAIVNERGLGRLVENLAPEQIASTINGLGRPFIDGAKRRALEAAREMCWEREQERMLGLAAQLLMENRASEARPTGSHFQEG